MTETAYELNESLKDFESQFNRKAFIWRKGGRTEIRDVTPGQLDHPTPVFYAAGMGGTPEGNKPIIKTLYETGRRVLTAQYDRILGRADVTKETPKIHHEALRKAQSMIAVIEDRVAGPVDVIGHSEGALVAAIAATMRPELFRNIIFMDPAGMVGPDTVGNLIKRQGIENEALAKREVTDPVYAKWAESDGPAFVTHLLQSQLGIRAFMELRAVTKTEIHEMLRALHEKGIGIAVVSGVEDDVFPMAELQKVASANLAEINPDTKESSKFYIDGFVSVAGAHNEHHIQPEKYMKAMGDVLTSLEKKTIKKDAGKPAI